MIRDIFNCDSAGDFHPKETGVCAKKLVPAEHCKMDVPNVGTAGVSGCWDSYSKNTKK